MNLQKTMQDWEEELDNLKLASEKLNSNTSEYLITISRYDQIKKCLSDLRNSLNEPITINGVTLYPERYEIVIDSDRYIFPKKEFKMLNYIVNNPNRCISRTELLRNCWEDGVIVGERTIDVHICKIKRKIKDRIDIKTHKGVGYKLKIN